MKPGIRRREGEKPKMMTLFHSNDDNRERERERERERAQQCDRTQFSPLLFFKKPILFFSGPKCQNTKVFFLGGEIVTGNSRSSLPS